MNLGLYRDKPKDQLRAAKEKTENFRFRQSFHFLYFSNNEDVILQFEVCKAVSVKGMVFCDMAPSIFVNEHHSLGRMCCLHLPEDRSSRTSQNADYISIYTVSYRIRL